MKTKLEKDTIVYALIEWTEKYSKICDTVNGYGF